MRDKIPLNWELLDNPLNWVVVLLMVALAGAGITLIVSTIHRGT